MSGRVSRHATKRFTAAVFALALLVLSVRPAPASTIYFATLDTGGSTGGQSDVLNSAVTSAIQVANSYGFSGVRLGQSFDPLNPLALCLTDKPARRQASQQLEQATGQQNAQNTGQPSGATSPQPPAARSVAPSAGNDNGQGAATSQPLLLPGDLLFALTVTRANQDFNKFTGVFTNDVLLNITQVNCDNPASNRATMVNSLAATTQRQGWNGAAKGALIEHYNQNPVTGLSSVAALLTSPWVNKYRLWLTVPITFLDSFKHEKQSLDGTIYCATTEAMLDLLYENGRIRIADSRAYQIDAGDPTRWYRVPGVNYCKQDQPVRPKLDEPSVTTGNRTP